MTNVCDRYRLRPSAAFAIASQRSDRGPMRLLRYSINVTVDGCCDHQVIPADEESGHGSKVPISRSSLMSPGS